MLLWLQRGFDKPDPVIFADSSLDKHLIGGIGHVLYWVRVTDTPIDSSRYQIEPRTFDISVPSLRNQMTRPPDFGALETIFNKEVSVKKIAVIVLGVLMLGSNVYAKVKTLEKVDLGRFAGTWYRISANPIAYEPKSACSRQVLTPTADGRVAVYNSGNVSSGKLFEIRGFAEPIDSSGSKLEVDFGLPWKGSYWIIGLDSDYRYAVVTDAYSYSLYIMARTPQMDPQDYRKMVAQVAGMIDTSRLRMERQAGCTYPPIN